MELEDVVEDAGIVILGLGWSEVGVVGVEDELDMERLALSVVGDERLGFGVDELPVSDGSMTENTVRQHHSGKNEK